MLGRRTGTIGAATEAMSSGLSPYVDQLAHDEKLRRRLLAAVSASVAARKRVKRQAGLVGVATRLASDPVLRAQVAEALDQFQKAKGRMRKHRSHTMRNWILLLSGGGVVVAAVPSLRSCVMTKLRGRDGSVSRGDRNATAHARLSDSVPRNSGRSRSGRSRSRHTSTPKERSSSTTTGTVCGPTIARRSPPANAKTRTSPRNSSGNVGPLRRALSAWSRVSRLTTWSSPAN